MCGLRTRPRMDVDPPRFLDRTAIGAGISSRCPRDDTLFSFIFHYAVQCAKRSAGYNVHTLVHVTRCRIPSTRINHYLPG